MRHVRWLGFIALAAGCMTRETREEKAESFTAQAAQGAELFSNHCAKCHGAMGQGTTKAPRVVGLNEGALPLTPPATRKKRTMPFRTVADVARFVVVNMPADDPGSLSEADYLRILAFDLKANGIDLGNQSLDMQVAESLEIPREGQKPVSER